MPVSPAEFSNTTSVISNCLPAGIGAGGEDDERRVVRHRQRGGRRRQPEGGRCALAEHAALTDRSGNRRRRRCAPPPPPPACLVALWAAWLALPAALVAASSAACCAVLAWFAASAAAATCGFTASFAVDSITDLNTVCHRMKSTSAAASKREQQLQEPLREKLLLHDDAVGVHRRAGAIFVEDSDLEGQRLRIATPERSPRANEHVRERCLARCEVHDRRIDDHPEVVLFLLDEELDRSATCSRVVDGELGRTSPLEPDRPRHELGLHLVERQDADRALDDRGARSVFARHDADGERRRHRPAPTTTEAERR